MRGIAGYDFVWRLGKGSHGEFFMARRPEWLPVDAKYVTVKVVNGNGEAGPADDAARQATHELGVFATVRSPYLVTLYDAGQQAGTLYYSMEFLPAARPLGSSRDLRRRTRLLKALADAARAVQALHDAGMVHRDIKPGNVLLTAEGGKLADLGLVQTVSAGTELTRMGEPHSAEFVDPSVLRGEEPAPAGDIWSLGASIHYLVAGVGLYGDLPVHDPLLTLRTVLGSRPRIAEGVDPAAAELIRACVGAQDGRPTAAEVADRLESLASPAPGSAPGMAGTAHA